MSDTNIEHSGECQECIALQNFLQTKLDKIDALCKQLDQADEENKKLKEALKTCIDGLMYESTTGTLWMWARSNEAVSHKFLQARKLVYP